MVNVQLKLGVNGIVLFFYRQFIFQVSGEFYDFLPVLNSEFVL